MLLYLLDKNFQKIALITQYVSLIWTERYQDAGDFELYIPADQLGLIEKGMYLQRVNNDNGCLMCIENVILTEDEENGDYITVSGRSSEKILGERVIWYKTRTSGNAEMALYSLFHRNFLASDVSARNISRFAVAAYKGLAGTIKSEYNGESFLETVQAACIDNGFGFRLIYGSGAFTFEIYKGTDRSYSQNQNDFVVFSPLFSNLAKSDYTQDTSEVRNVCLTYAESSQSGYGRRYVSVGTASGLDRKEGFVDCGTDDEDTLMQGEANTFLSEHKEIHEFEGEIIPKDGWEEEYGLGDIVQLENDYGNSAKVRISEIIESDNEEGHTIVPTFEVIS